MRCCVCAFKDREGRRTRRKQLAEIDEVHRKITTTSLAQCSSEAIHLYKVLRRRTTIPSETYSISTSSFCRDLSITSSKLKHIVDLLNPIIELGGDVVNIFPDTNGYRHRIFGIRDLQNTLETRCGFRSEQVWIEKDSIKKFVHP